ncbi:hypothetical protein ACFY1S_26180 [Micromonospora sp. NPDC000663]|uniref:hypothetical protein n=1 Tax=Micromonospora sp. NPDC000663 TaxID=3364218 RepID=UPI00369DF767
MNPPPSAGDRDTGRHDGPGGRSAGPREPELAVASATDGPTVGRDDGRLVVVLDFPGRREEAKLSDLRLEEAGFTVRYLLAESLPTAPEGRAHVDELAGRLRGEGRVSAVLAYCLAAPIGLTLASRIEQDPAPLVMVFDGAPGSAEAVRTAYGNAVRQLGGRAVDARRPVVTEDGLAENPSGLMKEMEATLRRLAVEVLELDGEPEEVLTVADQVVGRHTCWLTHLTAAATLPGAPRADDVHVVSRDHPRGGAWFQADLVPIDVPRPELATCPATRRAVIDRLRQAA